MKKRVQVSGGMAYKSTNQTGSFPKGDPAATHAQIAYLRIRGWSEEQLAGLSREHASKAIAQMRRSDEVDPTLLDWE